MIIPGCWSTAGSSRTRTPGPARSCSAGRLPAGGCLRSSDCDNGAPFANAWLARPCAVLGGRRGHRQPSSPQGRGKQESLNRYIREAFLAEATHQGIESLEQLNDLFAAWAGQVANRRAHAETGQAPIGRFEAGGPPPQADPGLLREAFPWSVTRKVTRTATAPLEGKTYAVHPALLGRRRVQRHRPHAPNRPRPRLH